MLDPEKVKPPFENEGYLEKHNPVGFKEFYTLMEQIAFLSRCKNIYAPNATLARESISQLLSKALSIVKQSIKDIDNVDTNSR